MKRVVISQPMFFPWVGMLEQVHHADVFVHYDDVQYSRGGFTNRVQLKTPKGKKWLTVPLSNLHLGQEIRDVQTDEARAWRDQHRQLLALAFAGAPHSMDALTVAQSVHSQPSNSLAEIAIASFESLLDFFGLREGREFVHSSALNIPGRSSQRVLDVVRAVGGDVYITGHGARDYLDHELFEKASVRVEYIDYKKAPYPQLHGPFDPFVTALDLIANCGTAGREFICSGTRHWKDFLA